MQSSLNTAVAAALYQCFRKFYLFHGSDLGIPHCTNCAVCAVSGYFVPAVGKPDLLCFFLLLGGVYIKEQDV